MTFTLLAALAIQGLLNMAVQIGPKPCRRREFVAVAAARFCRKHPVLRR